MSERANGWWWYRDYPNHWWAATQVQNGNITGKWLMGTGRVEQCKGEWSGPLDPCDPFLLEAQATPGGLLYRMDEETGITPTA